MKKISLLVCALAFATGINTTNAQDSTRSVSDQPGGTSSAKPVWIFGLHGVVVDDDGNTFGNLFNVGDSWNFLPYPTRLTVERSLNLAWRLEGSVAYSQYKAGKLVNDEMVLSSQPFVAVDVNAKYDLNALFGETSVFDPYTVSGLGFTHRSGLRNDKNTPNLNLGLGFNIWFNKNWGINLQTTAKIKLNPKSSNYLMHTAGLVYRLNYEKDADVDKGSGSIREVR